MRFRPLGQSGIEASVVAFGGWPISGGYWGSTDERGAIEAVNSALDAGVNFIDTAPVYGFGISEDIVGRVIKSHRDQVVLATKCGLIWDSALGTHFVDVEGTPVYRYLGAESIRKEVDRSLTRLQTDYIDLYQTHWQDATTPIEETMSALMDLKQQGKIRAIGVSNATVEQMDEYRKIGPIDSDQELYSMLDRALEDEQLPYCRESNIAVLAYSPLAQGLLTGTMTTDRELAEGDQRANLPRFSEKNRRKVNEFLELLRPIAEEHDATLSQLTLAWTLAQPGLTHVLAGSRDAEQTRQNAAAADILLSDDEWRSIAEALSGLDLS
jgi:methylglyoxal reductase